MTMIIPAGEFDRQVTLQAKSVTRDPAYGAEAVTWSPYAAGLWAKVRERVNESSGDESVTQGLRVNRAQVTVIVRWLAGVLPTMRVLLDDGRALQIQSLATLGRNEYITLACEQWREG